MSDDSGDSSDLEPRPSGSKSRPMTRTRANTTSKRGRSRGGDQKRNHRIVMRIEFDDSDDDEESCSATEASSDDNENAANNGDLDEQPSCSRKRVAASSKNTQGKLQSKQDDDADDSDEFRRNAKQRLRNRRVNVLYGDGRDSDGSSSGSEITRRIKTRNSKPLKKLIMSEDDQSPLNAVNEQQAQTQQAAKESADEAGFTSDSSSNEMLEKCPICLLTFRQQEIGSPATCEHIYCANCIEAWSKNVQTCPIDRIEFDRIIVRESYANRNIVREINVDANKGQKEPEADDEDVTYCEICTNSDREDVMLLCDSCNQGYHMDCLSPPLTSIPEGSWYCDNCFDSQDEEEEGDVEEDLHMLYEDIRDMGIPEASLRVTEVHQPRILRTRQNERIRAAILRHTRSRAARTETTTTTTTSTSTRRGRPRNTSTTTTTTTLTRTTRARNTSRPQTERKTRKRRRRRARRRTYVVEYDLNNFDEKFAIKTTKKIIKRRRRKRRGVARSSLQSTTGGRLTASQRLAEQLGIKKDPTYSSHLSGTSAGLSLFGSANDLEYFSDSDHGGIEHEIELETGHGTAVQTSVRISSFGSQRSQKGLLLGRLQRNPRALPIPDAVGPSSADLLSSIMDMQDRWHNATRNMENVHINADGTLNLPQGNIGNSDANSNSNPCPSVENQSPESNTTQTQSAPNFNELVTQAPMYPRGGGNSNFNSSGGGGGNYNNRFNNQGGYRGGGGGGGGSGGGGGGGGSNQYRHSTGGMMTASNTGNLQNMVGRGNFNFSSPNYSANQNSNNFSPFSIRFNQRNQQNNQRNNNNNNNQRNSLPFINRNDQNNLQQQQQQQHQQQQQNSNFNPQMSNANFNLSQQQQQNTSRDNNLFGGLPPPMASQSQNHQNDNQLFSGLPPPVAAPVLVTGPPPPLGQMPEARIATNPPVGIPALMTIPPPPAPPPGVHMPWNNSLYQLNNDYGNEDDDSNCPNFSVYSAESQEVAKSSELKQTQEDGEAPKWENLQMNTSKFMMMCRTQLWNYKSRISFCAS